jgi:formylglycine-generating enzyme required for sulfatase activity
MGRSGVRDNESPVHWVEVSYFEMATVPVTNAHFRLYLEATASAPPPYLASSGFDRPDAPVVGVSFEEARRYCRWLSRESGLPLRLPTEAEREKASRGGVEGAVFPWGDEPEGGGHASVKGPLGGPVPVRSTAPNGYGLHHMADNVHEWCLDAYLPDFYRDSPAVDPVARGGGRRSARGGSWRHAIVVTACAARSNLPPSFHYADFGFRWVTSQQSTVNSQQKGAGESSDC